MEKVRALKPDLIIGNKEENDKKDIEALAAEFPGLDERCARPARCLGHDPPGGNLTGTTELDEPMALKIEAGSWHCDQPTPNTQWPI